MNQEDRKILNHGQALAMNGQKTLRQIADEISARKKQLPAPEREEEANREAISSFPVS